MNPNTQQIIDDPTDEQIEREKLVPIPPDQIDAVRGMNRKQRRAWLAQQRHAKTDEPRHA